jgi:hypothetical protein
MFGEIIAFYCENHKNHKHKLQIHWLLKQMLHV